MTANRWFESGSCSLVGDRHLNQDRVAIFHKEPLLFLVLADGMGGHPRGDRAAEIAIETCKEAFESTAKPVPDPKRFLIRTLQKAHEKITLFGLEQSPQIEPRTTVVAALIQEGVLFLAHAGDSRLYLVREARILHRTTDHSYIELLRQQGVATDRKTEESSRRHFVTKCLGGSLTLPSIFPEEAALENGDLLVLCSDGFWSQIDEEEGLDTLCRNDNLAMTTNRMAHEAVQAAPGESDNVSLITLRFFDLPGGTTKKQTTSPARNDGEVDLQTAVRTLEAAIKIARSRDDKE